MSLTRWTAIAALWFLPAVSAIAQDASMPDPLFQSDAVLEVRIIAPMSTILSERPNEDELPAKFRFTSSAGEAIVLDIKIRTRGRFRRMKDVCGFPPMRLNFNKSQTKGTLFRKQNKVKLVTHCQSSSRYEQVLLREYLAYRILNILTDTSYRVRLLRITYVNTEKNNRETVRNGFIIEHRDRLARRIGKPVLEIPRTRIAALNPQYSNLISMYHYLIGNTDFSPILAAKGETCCHNHVLFGTQDTPLWSVPYDFDQAGFVFAPHASPNEKFRLRSVKERLYRGRCVNNEHIDANIALYRSHHEEMLQLIAEFDPATAGSKKMMARYIDKFYATIDSPRQVQRRLLRKCI